MTVLFNPQAEQRGFILIEILVALAVLGLVTAPILALFITGYDSLAGAGHITGALNLARRRMEQVKSLGYGEACRYYLEEGNSPEATSEGAFLVETTVTPEPLIIKSSAALPEAELLRITVTVSWGEGEQRRSRQVASCLAGR